MLRSLIAVLKFTLLKAPIAITATGTSDSLALAEYGSCALNVQVGDFAFSTANKLDLVVRDSDDGTTFTLATDVYPANESSTAAKSLDSTAEKNALYTFHYRGNKAYVQVGYVETGTVDVVLGVTAVLGHNKLMPPA